MAITIAAAQTNSTYYNTTAATSRTTGAMNYTSGNALVVIALCRATDLASMAAESIALSCAGNTFTAIGSQAEFDASSRFKVACFLVTGGTGGAIVFTTAGGTRSCDRWELHAVEIAGTAHISGATVPSNVQQGTSTGTGLGIANLSAMAGTSYTLLIGGSDASAVTLSPEASWTGINTGTNQTFSAYLNGPDTTIGTTKTGSVESYAFAMEILALATGSAGNQRGTSRGVLRGVLRGTI